MENFTQYCAVFIHTNPTIFPPVRTVPIIAQRLAIFSSRTFEKGQFEVKQAKPLNCPSFFRRILRYGGKLDNYLKSKYIFLFLKLRHRVFFSTETATFLNCLYRWFFKSSLKIYHFSRSIKSNINSLLPSEI